MRKNEPTGGRVQITTSIPYEWYKKIKANVWKYNELVGLGITAKENNPQILERIKELERGNKKLQSKLTQFAGRLAAQD